VTIVPRETVISAGLKEKSLIETLAVCPASGTGGTVVGFGGGTAGIAIGAELVTLVAGAEVAMGVVGIGAGVGIGVGARDGTGLSVIVRELGRLGSIVVSAG